MNNSTLLLHENANASAQAFSVKDGANLAMGTGTVFLNCVVLAVAFRHIDLKTRLSQIFVVSMTFADLFFGISYVMTKPVMGWMSLWMCGPYYILVWSCSMGSVLFLLYLNADKFLALYYPLHYPQIVTERKVVLQTSLTWVVLLVYTTVSYYWGFGGMITQNTDHNKTGPPSCTTILTVHPLFYGIYTLMIYVLPILISLFISIYIFYIATTIGNSELSAHRRQKRRKLLFTRILFVFSSTLWTSLTFLPYRVAYATYNFCAATLDPSSSKFGNELDACTPPLFKTLTDAFVIILPFGGLVNPLITIVTQRTYRRRVLVWLAAGLGVLRIRLRPPSLRHLDEDDERTMDYASSLRGSARHSARLPHNSSQTCFRVNPVPPRGALPHSHKYPNAMDRIKSAPPILKF